MNDSASVNIEDHKSSVLLLILLTFVTAGIYAPVWFLRRKPLFDALDSSETAVSSGTATGAIIAWSASLLTTIASGVAGASDGLDAVDRLLTLVGSVMLLILSFQAKRRMTQHLLRVGQHDPLSGLATFFFQHYYLQYRINRMAPLLDVARHFD